MGTVSRMHAWKLVLCLSLLSAGFSPHTHAEDRSAALAHAAAADGANHVQAILQRGQHLETNQRWGDALTLYEEAVRSNPGATELKQRLQLARFHYEVRRRYQDASFVNSVVRMSSREASDMFADVLYKIESHYVETPDWAMLLNKGAANLRVSLTEPVFVKHHLANVPRTQTQQFAAKLDQLSQQLQPRNRQEAIQTANHIAQHAWNDLRLAHAGTMLALLCGATSSLDPYSTYLTTSQLDEVYQQIEGNFVGLGVELKTREQDLLILNVIEGGPASRSGMRPGDRIVGVDGQSTRTIPTGRAADMLRGPEGSEVSIQLERGTRQTETLTLRIRRQQIEVPSVDRVKIVDNTGGVGYLRINSFQKTTTRDVDNALWKLHRQGMRCLVVDLRGNPGGLLSESVAVADRFVSAGTIVSTRGRSYRENFQFYAHRAGTWQVPVVVLIDGNSASASEILAAAIHDHRRGVVVGQRSYGKGSVQGIFHIAGSGSGLRLTTARFYSPNGTKISGTGVEPDVKVHQVARPVLDDGTPEQPTASIDVALSAAIEAAKKQVRLLAAS